MIKISIWAKANQATARLIIILIHFALAFLGILTGLLLVKTNLNISALVFYLVLLVYIFAFFLYPKRGGFCGFKYKVKIYLVQKSCDFALSFCTFWMISFCSQHYFATPKVGTLSYPFVNQVFASKGSDPTAEEILRSLKYRSRNELTRSEKKILKHEFIKQVQVYAKAKLKGDNHVAAKVFLIILTIAAAVGLAYLLAGLACSAFLPLSISLGGTEFPRLSAVIAGELIAFYQLGYGVAAFGIGPLRDWIGLPFHTIFAAASIVAALLAVFAFLAVRLRPPLGSS